MESTVQVKMPVRESNSVYYFKLLGILSLSLFLLNTLVHRHARQPYELNAVTEDADGLQANTDANYRDVTQSSLITGLRVENFDIGFVTDKPGFVDNEAELEDPMFEPDAFQDETMPSTASVSTAPETTADTSTSALTTEGVSMPTTADTTRSGPSAIEQQKNEVTLQYTTTVAPKKELETTPSITKLMPSTTTTKTTTTTSSTKPPQTTTPRPTINHPLPDCLVVGVRKAGTRALTKFLSNHPNIVVVGHEVQFFNIPNNYKKGIDWYRSQMPSILEGQVLVEKSAEYFHVMQVAPRVKAMKPSMKMIVVLRDPFDRMVSDYFFIKRYAKTYNVAYPFAELNHTLEELVMDNSTGRLKFTHGGLHRSEYVKFFKHWLQYFPMKQILVINGDEISKSNPAGELQKVEKFLGLEPFVTEDMFAYNDTKKYYCSTISGCLGEEKGHVHPTFDPFFEKVVRGYFQHYNKMLYELLGTNFNWQ